MEFLLILSVIVSFIVWAILKNNNDERRKFAIYIFKLWLFILIGGIISHIIGLNYYNHNIYNLKNTNDPYTGILLALIFMNVILLAFLSGTILFNLYKTVSSDWFLRFLSFFTIPTFVLLLELVPFNDPSYKNKNVLLYTTAIPFWIVLAIAFIAFSIKYEKKFKHLKNS